MKKTAFAIGLIALAAGSLGASMLRLDKPNGGETLAPGTIYDIAWTATGVTQNVKLILLQNGAIVGSIAGDLAPGSSPYKWTVGRFSSGNATPGTGFAVRVRTMDNSMGDISDGTFTIDGQEPAPSLKVTFPVGGESFKWGTMQPFQWKATHFSGNVKAVLLRNGSPAFELSPSTPAAAGAVCWTIGDAPGWSCASHCGGGYKLRVEALDGTLAAESPGAFAITADPSSGEGDPDFAASELIVKPELKFDINHGQVLVLNVLLRFRNNGAFYQGPLKIHYVYLDALKGSKISKDAVLEIPSIDIEHGQDRVVPLCTVEDIPLGVESITFGAMLDPDNRISETSEGNNYASQTHQMSRRPDLEVMEYGMPSTIYCGDVFDVFFTVRNRGMLPAEQFNVRVALEDDKQNFVVSEYSATIPRLEGGASRRLQFRKSFISSLPHSGYFRFEADFDDRILEPNEKDNRRWLAYTLQPAADLSFKSARAWQEGMKLRCEFIVANKGYANSEGACAFIHVSGHGYDGYCGKVELGSIPMGSDRVFSSVIESQWGKGDCLVLFELDDCRRFEGGPRGLSYHEADPRDNRSEVRIHWQ